MAVLLRVLWPLERLNTGILSVGRVIAVIALAVMVCLILGQVFFRYVLNEAPNWTEEGARFGMIWMTGFMAPIAYRQGGFVAIDMLERALTRTMATLLGLGLLFIALWVLVIAWDKGLNNHVDSLSGRGCSSSLRWPFGIEIGKLRQQVRQQLSVCRSLGRDKPADPGQPRTDPARDHHAAGRRGPSERSFR